MTVDEAAEERRAALDRVDELQREGELSASESRTIREDLHEAISGEEIMELYENYLGKDSESPDWSDPGRPQKELPDGVLRTLAKIWGPATANEVAEELHESYRLIRRRLKELHEEGLIEQKKIAGRITIWWLNEEGEPYVAGELDGDELENTE